MHQAEEETRRCGCHPEPRARFLAGLGDRAIANGLNRDRIPCPSARRPEQNTHRLADGWQGSTVRSILDNLRYTGYAIFGRWTKQETLLDPDDIFMAQVPELIDVPWPVYPLFAAGLALMVAFPRLTKAVPAPLVSIVALTALTVAAGIAVPAVGDKGALPTALPVPGLPQVPFTLDTLTLLAPYAVAFALVGLMESLMTANSWTDITDTHSNKTRESVGQGIGNVVTGFSSAAWAAAR